MIRIFAMTALTIAAPVLAQQPQADQVRRAVAADWPKHDRSGKGHLTRAEFSTWLVSLRAAAGKREDPARVFAWADGAFPQADADADAEVSPEEFTTFLQSKVRRTVSSDR